MYDIAVMLTGMPDKLIVMADLFALNFRVSHLNDKFLTWFAGVRIACIVVTSCVIFLYLLASCSRSGLNMNAYTELNLNQCWILILLILCALYDEPLFELRRSNPSVALAVVAEVPASAFFTALLSYWLMSVTYVRVSQSKI